MTYPLDWQEMTLGDLGHIQMCRRIFQSQTKTSGDIPFYKIGTFGGEADAYIPRKLYEHYKNKYPYPAKGDILISAAGTIGKTIVFDGKDAYFQDSNIVWLKVNENLIDRQFLFWFCRSFPWRSLEGSTIQRLYNSIILGTKIFLPPLEEQKAIAETLATFDEYIDALAALIDKKKNIRNGALEDLMSGKNRLPGFCDDWQEKKLGECVRQKLSYGINAPAINYDGKNPAYIRITDITDEGKFSGQDRKSVATQEQEKYTLHHGDILLARTGASTGKTYLYDEKDGSLVYAGFLIKASIDVQKYDPRFIFGQLRTQKYWAWVAATSMRSGQPGINSKEYASFSISVPPLAEQKAIAEVLSAMDEEIEALTAEREKIIALRAGAMDELLTGKIRLKSEA